jgi:hypothetical protein
MSEYDIDYEDLIKDCCGICGMTVEEVFIDVLQNHACYHSEAELDVLMKMKEWRAKHDS